MTGWWHSLLGFVGSTSSSEQVVLRGITHGHRARDKRCGRGCRQQPVLCTRRAAPGQGQHAKERFQFSCLLHGTILVTSEGKDRQTVAFALVPCTVPASSGHPDWKGHTATNRGAAGPCKHQSMQCLAPEPAGCSPGPTRTAPQPHVAPCPAGPGGPAAARAESPRRGKRASRGAPAPYRAHFPVKTRSNLHPAAGSTCLSSGFKEAARRGFGTTRGAGTAKHWGAVAGEERGASPAGRSDPRALSAGTAGWETPRLGSSKGGSQTKQKRKWEREVGETLKEAGLGTGAARQRAGKAEVPAAKRA